MQLADQRAVVTGATGGIGQAIARALGREGVRLVVTGRRSDHLETLARELDAEPVLADLADRHEASRLPERVGDVDILVANAALPATGTIDDFAVGEIDAALDVNLRSSIILARGFLPGMLERGNGHMVFVSSLAGKAATRRSAIYCATKFGLRGFALSLRQDLRATGVGVSVVFPGFIREAGMFAEADVHLPRGIGTRPPSKVADAVIKCIHKDDAEAYVAPPNLRYGAVIGGVAPSAAAVVTRWFGGDGIADQVAAGQRAKRL
jgi:short-subunit dehydrogenase